MNRTELIIFKKDTDAVGPNRGFIYQYLKTLVVWLKNYKENKDIKIYCEVEDDIKEIDNINKTLKYSQLKCYSSVLSLSSDDVKKSLYNFFLLFLINEDYDGTFLFETNTTISSKDNLLANWIFNEGRVELDTDLLTQCITKVQDILLNQLIVEINSYEKNIASKMETQKKILKKESESKKNKDKANNVIVQLKCDLEEYKIKSESLKQEITNESNIKLFINRIQWKFSSINAENSLNVLKTEAIEIIRCIAGEKGNYELYFSRLLTEVSFKATYSEKDDRLLDNQLMQTILTQTEDEIRDKISEKLIDEFKKCLDESLSIGFAGVQTQINDLGERLEQKLEEMNLPYNGNSLNNNEYELVYLPPKDENIIKNYIDNENNDNQSKLETKIMKMENVDQDMKEVLLNMGTEYRCKYLIHLEELKLTSSKAHEKVKILEAKVENLCTKTTRGLRKIELIDSNDIYEDLEENLKVLLNEFNNEILKNGLKIDIDIVTGQMFHMAAKCSLRWHKEVLTS